LKGYAISSSIGLVVGFVATGYLRDLLVWEFTLDASPLTAKAVQLGMMLVVLCGFKTVTAMAWGHFAAKKNPDTVQAGEYFPSKWHRAGWISSTVMNFLFQQLQQRWSQLKGQAQQMNEANPLIPKSLIPKSLHTMHGQELERLQAWFSEADKSREKF
jgi:hypothetical protein